jgi:type IX secretion system PorP/SprF family membrane protein
MKIIKTFLFLATAITSATNVSAQDAHFLQYNAAPLLLNPALTGEHQPNGEYPSHAITLNYANYWASVLKAKAFSVYSANYARTIPVGRADFFAAGISVGGDRAGSLDFSNGNAKLTAAYSRWVGGDKKKNHYLQVGLEGGVAAVSSPVYSRYGTETAVLPDAGAGIAWQTNLDYNNYFNIGFSAAHLSRAHQSFVNDRLEGFYTKFTTHANGEFKLKRKISILPAVAYYTQGPTQEFTSGAAFKYNISKNKREYQALQLGVFTRFDNQDKGITADALLWTARFDYDNLALNFSYNTNISPFTVNQQGNGGFEIGLRYKIYEGIERTSAVPIF